MKKWLMATALAGALVLSQQAAVEAQVFKDVKDERQNYVLQKLVSANIIDDGDYFLPSTGMTRAEMADALARAYKLYDQRPATEFADVPKNHEHYEAIQALYRAGIVDGNEGNFNPDGVVKRAHVAKVLTNLLKLTPQQTTAFKDVPLTDANNAYVGALISKGLTTGFEDGTFRPNQHVTKVQFATFVYRALYGKEPSFTAPKQITSNLDFAPTKISSANYRASFDGGMENIFIQYDKNGYGATKGTEDTDPIYIGFGKTYISSGLIEGTIEYFNVDLRNVSETPKSVTKVEVLGGIEYDSSHVVKAAFNQEVKTSKLTIKGVTKVSYHYEESDYTEELYFKEGYGLIKHIVNAETVWELVGYKQR